MAKSTKATKKSNSESIAWSFTILTLAITCAALSALISENQQLKQENYQLTLERVQ